MTFRFDTAEDATQGCDFFNGLSASSLDAFSDICMQGKPRALELSDATGAKRALSLLSPTNAAPDSALTPHYEEEVLSKRVKVESDLDAATPELGLSSDAGPVNVKIEATACLLPPTPPAASIVDTPALICDFLSALDTDVVVMGISSRPLFARRLPLSLKVHPDIEKIAPEAYRHMRVLHLNHFDTQIEHEVMWSFAFGSIYFPLYFLTQYIVETNPNTLMLGTCEANPLGILPTHLHDVCWSKSTCDSKQLCRETWDYVIGKGHKLKEKFKKVALDLWPKHMVVNPSTSIPI